MKQQGNERDTLADNERRVDRELAAIFAGQDQAKRWLYDHYAPRLYRRLRGRYGHWRRINVDDLLHDAYVLFFRDEAATLRRFTEQHPPHRQTEARLDRFLWDTACGLASNRRRAIKNAPETEELPISLAEANPLEQRLVQRDQLERLLQEVRDRDTQLYLYFKLRYVDGLTPAEICDVTGWPRERAYRLRDRLVEVLDPLMASLGLAQ